MLLWLVSADHSLTGGKYGEAVQRLLGILASERQICLKPKIKMLLDHARMCLFSDHTLAVRKKRMSNS